jgi:uncharacterized protein (TIGR02145 family)
MKKLTLFYTLFPFLFSACFLNSSPSSDHVDPELSSSSFDYKSLCKKPRDCTPNQIPVLHGHFYDSTSKINYPTIVIGRQEWFASNYGTHPDSNQYRFYGLESAYQLHTVQDTAYLLTNPPFLQGICPDGWRLPTLADLDSLKQNIGPDSVDVLRAKTYNTTNNPQDAYYTEMIGDTTKLDLYGFRWFSYKDLDAPHRWETELWTSHYSVDRLGRLDGLLSNLKGSPIWASTEIFGAFGVVRCLRNVKRSDLDPFNH